MFFCGRPALSRFALRSSGFVNKFCFWVVTVRLADCNNQPGAHLTLSSKKQTALDMGVFNLSLVSDRGAIFFEAAANVKTLIRL